MFRNAHAQNTVGAKEHGGCVQDLPLGTIPYHDDSSVNEILKYNRTEDCCNLGQRR